VTGSGPYSFTIDAQAAIAGISRMPDELRQKLAAALVQGSFELQRAIVEATPTSGAGTLRQSIQAQPVEITAEAVQVTVSTALAYALPVETGSKPHMPPEAPIREWVIRRGLVGRPRTASGRPSKAKDRVQDYERQIDDVVAAVRWKIFTKGTPAARMFQVGFERTQASIVRRIQGAVGTALSGGGT
jgi:hypothetical protein